MKLKATFLSALLILGVAVLSVSAPTFVYAAPCAATGTSLNQSVYYESVGATFTVTFTIGGSNTSSCTNALNDDIAGNYILIPTSATTLDCNGATCSQTGGSGITTLVKTLKCESAGVYSIVGSASASAVGTGSSGNSTARSFVVCGGASLTTVVLSSNPGTVNQSWSVPSDWSSTNEIECIGSGGAGATVSATAGAGGGAGAFARVGNLPSLSGSVTYTIGASATTTGTDNATAAPRETYFNGTASSSASLTCDWGGVGNGLTAGTAGSIAQSIGTTTFAGAAGAVGESGQGSGGGAGSAGPTGLGRTGGADSNSNAAGGGGGGTDAALSTVGAAPTVSGTGGAGGKGPQGAAGGTGGGLSVNGGSGSSGSGGGGGGQSAHGGAGSCDTSLDGSHGACSGGGGAGFGGGVGGNAGTYGGGGGGGNTTGGTGGTGGQGIIVIYYVPSSPSSNSTPLLNWILQWWYIF